MIAKAKAITHGCNAIRYALDKEKADVIKMNLLDDSLDATAVWAQMLIHRKRCEGLFGKHRPLTNDTIRIEISPARSETAGWTRQDWEKLVDDFIKAFDSIDLSAATGSPRSQSTNLAQSQYAVALHHDSKSGIDHLHLIANRVDNDGNINDDHMIHRRAMQAAAMVNVQRGWKQADDIQRENVNQVYTDCLETLRRMSRFSWSQYCEELEKLGYGILLKCDKTGQVHGYSVKKGNTTYKSSVLGPGRHLMPSQIEQTWRQLHRASEKRTDSYKDRLGQHEKGTASIQRPDVLYRISVSSNIMDVHLPYDIHTLINNAISPDDIPSNVSRTDVVSIAVVLFAGMIEAATNISSSCGGGGSSPSSDWGRDSKEDDREWALRCVRMAKMMSRPKRHGLKR